MPIYGLRFGVPFYIIISMAAEIEILVRVEAGKDELLRHLEENATFVGRYETVDQYYFDPTRADLQPDRQGRLSGALRVRKKGDQSHVTFKKDNFDPSGKWTYSDEFETSVADGDVMREIFRRLGLRRLTTVDMTKLIYMSGDFEIVVEDVRNLGAFLEIEFKGPKDLAPSIAKERIASFMTTLPGQFTRDFDGGKPELMVQQNGVEERDFSDITR